ncbi:MAG: hypothetical protein OSB41_14260 [Kiritimatiellae bacterium]|nr:hypothetical protein [Kiritimatiellia bacterium]
MRPVFLDYNAYTKRKSLMLAGGNLPDVIWDGDPGPVRKNVRNGFVMAVPPEVILKYAPTYVKQLNRFGRIGWAHSHWRGRNYGIPTYASADIYPHPLFWRMDWLRNVGIHKIPDTLEEVHEAFTRFRHNDPDGNGKKDTYGMCPSTMWFVMFAEFFAAHNTMAFEFNLRDGKAVWGGILPEAKQTLKLMRQWYAEDLIDPDYIVLDNPGKVGRFQNGRCGYQYWFHSYRSLDLSNPSSPYSIMKQLSPTAEIASAPPLMGVDGRRRGRVWGGGAHIIQFGKHLEKEPRKVLRVLRMLETFAAEEEVFLSSRMGQRGVHWDLSPQRGAYLLPPFDATQAMQRNMLNADTLEGAWAFFSFCAAPTEITQKYMPQAQVEYRHTYRRPEWRIMNVLGKPDATESTGKHLETLWLMQKQAYAEIVNGERDLDYFDTFVEKWFKAGGAILTREANEMLKALPGIYSKVGIHAEETDSRLNDYTEGEEL